ncbi:Putative periplasmic protein [hydrothermal vent metagenome]|uniref:Periplasmic protein n=1 Tax=hydrothermal vent metagenome TaxID=652676 RepID=A0A3B1DRF1_9ZZZZ
MKFKKYYIYVIIFVYTLGFSGCSTAVPVSKKLVNKTSVLDLLPTTSPTIAIVFPSKVLGKWAIDATNSAISYMMYKENDFNIKVFNSINESEDSIQNVFSEISKEGISKILMLVTYDGASKLSTISNIDSYQIYLPLIDKNILDLNISSVIYGSIDYLQQFTALLEHSSEDEKIVDFYDRSKFGKQLSNSLSKVDNLNVLYKESINNNNGRYSVFLNKNNHALYQSTLIINMPIVKSSIVLSQINTKDINISKVLSTQLNYTPLLLSLTQLEDRKNMLIASSIFETNDKLEEYNALIDNDIKYNWVNYSTTIGIQYLINKDISSFYPVKLEKNKIVFPVQIFETTKYSFKSHNIL